MDKKELVAITEGIVKEIAAKHSLSEGEARTLVGIALRRNREAFISAVVVPQLGLVPNPA